MEGGGWGGGDRVGGRRETGLDLVNEVTGKDQDLTVPIIFSLLPSLGKKKRIIFSAQLHMLFPSSFHPPPTSSLPPFHRPHSQFFIFFKWSDQHMQARDQKVKWLQN